MKVKTVSIRPGVPFVSIKMGSKVTVWLWTDEGYTQFTGEVNGRTWTGRKDDGRKLCGISLEKVRRYSGKREA